MKFHTVVGLVILWRWDTIDGRLCRRCGVNLYNEAQRSTLLRGWWGVIAPVATIVAFIGNLGQVGAVKRLAQPQQQIPTTATLRASPLPSSPQWWKRPLSVLATIVALCLIALIGAVAVDSIPRSSGTSASSDTAAVTPTYTGTSDGTAVGDCWADLTDGLSQANCDDPAATLRVAQVGTSEADCSGYSNGYFSIPGTGSSTYYCLAVNTPGNAIEASSASAPIAPSAPPDPSTTRPEPSARNAPEAPATGPASEDDTARPSPEYTPTPEQVVLAGDFLCTRSAEDLPVLRPSSAEASATESLQVLLTLLGYEPGPFDGDYGPVTQRATKAFQTDSGIVVDAVVGPQTWATIRNSYC